MTNKKTQRISSRSKEKDEPKSFISGFIKMFKFRHGRSTSKALVAQSRQQKLRQNLLILSNQNKNQRSNKSDPQEANKKIETQPSVRKLMEDDFIFDHKKTEQEDNTSKQDSDKIPVSELVSDKPSSYFFLSDIKRKLKHVIRNEKHRLGKCFERNVSTKEHFFVENMTKLSRSHQISKVHCHDDNKEETHQYIEANKHLLEMLTNGGFDSRNKQVQKTLGKIFSFPEFSSPLSSTGKRLDQKSIAHSRSISADFNKSVTSLDSLQYKRRRNRAKTADDFIIFKDEEIVPEEISNSIIASLSSEIPKLEAFDDEIFKEISHEQAKEESLLAPDLLESSSILEPLIIEKDEIDDKGSVFKYIRSVLEAIDLNWEQLYLKAESTDELLEPKLINTIKFNPNQLCEDHELLFDLINGVLLQHCSDPPWISVKSRNKVPLSIGNMIPKIQGEVFSCLKPFAGLHSLDQLISEDMSKPRNWLDTRFDIEFIGNENSEMILDDLFEELIVDLFRRSSACKED